MLLRSSARRIPILAWASRAGCGPAWALSGKRFPRLPHPILLRKGRGCAHFAAPPPRHVMPLRSFILGGGSSLLQKGMSSLPQRMHPVLNARIPPQVGRAISSTQGDSAVAKNKNLTASFTLPLFGRAHAKARGKGDGEAPRCATSFLFLPRVFRDGCLCGPASLPPPPLSQGRPEILYQEELEMQFANL